MLRFYWADMSAHINALVSNIDSFESKKFFYLVKTIYYILSFSTENLELDFYTTSINIYHLSLTSMFSLALGG